MSDPTDRLVADIVDDLMRRIDQELTGTVVTRADIRALDLTEIGALALINQLLGIAHGIEVAAELDPDKAVATISHLRALVHRIDQATREQRWKL